jgi:hypothetical protein
MATVTGDQVASSLLTKLGAPNTASNRRALAIWAAFESGHNITGNNPYNITGTGNCGTHKFSGNSLTFATYCSLDDGIAATAQLLTSGRYASYTLIVTRLRTGDNGLGVLRAIAQSVWGTGHEATLVSMYNSLASYATWSFTLASGSSGTLPTAPPTGSLASTSTVLATSLADFQAKLRSIGIPDSPTHVITSTEAALIASKLYGVTSGIVYDGLVAFFTGKTVQEASKGGSAPDPISRIANTISDVFSALTNPQTYLRIIALGGGVILASWGGYIVWQATEK